MGDNPQANDLELHGANFLLIQNKMANLLDVNATYLALAAPTSAEVAAQVRRLTRECNILMRMVGNWLDATTGT